MYCVKKVHEDLYWVGASERRLSLFENVYPVPRGVSYNAYVLLDEKTVLLDTVDKSVSGLFFENLAHVLNGRKLAGLLTESALTGSGGVEIWPRLLPSSRQTRSRMSAVCQSLWHFCSSSSAAVQSFPCRRCLRRPTPCAL